MELKDIITLGLSGSSFAISLTALYLSNFRRANITASLGPTIHIYYYPPDQTGIYLPIIFHNQSPTKAIIYKLFLEVRNPRDNNFALSWQNKIQISTKNEYKVLDGAAPFKIDGFEAVSTAYQFMWYNSATAELRFDEGDYEIRLHVWLSEQKRPNIVVCERFDIDASLAGLMATALKRNDNNTRIIALAGKGIISFSTGTAPIDFANIPTP